MSIDDLFPSLYETRPGDYAAFFMHAHPPALFEYGVATHVATYAKMGGDGQPVEIWETRMPARFYTIKALESTNSVGDKKNAWSLSTGSDSAQLAADIARAVSNGMLDLTAFKCENCGFETRI